MYFPSLVDRLLREEIAKIRQVHRAEVDAVEGVKLEASRLLIHLTGERCLADVMEWSKIFG